VVQAAFIIQLFSLLGKEEQSLSSLFCALEVSFFLTHPVLRRPGLCPWDGCTCCSLPPDGPYPAAFRSLLPEQEKSEGLALRSSPHAGGVPPARGEGAAGYCCAPT